jgi:hypothetical protein
MRKELYSATAWGRYAELFAYDNKARMFSAITSAGRATDVVT